MHLTSMNWLIGSHQAHIVSFAYVFKVYFFCSHKLSNLKLIHSFLTPNKGFIIQFNALSIMTENICKRNWFVNRI